MPGSTAVAEWPEEEAVMPNPVDLEPQAKAVVDANANPPYLFELGPDQGRRTIDAVQSGPVKKLTVDFEDTTVPGGPSGQVWSPGCCTSPSGRSPTASRHPPSSTQP
jgi:hypothetical protein